MAAGAAAINGPHFSIRLVQDAEAARDVKQDAAGIWALERLGKPPGVFSDRVHIKRPYRL